MSHVSRVQALIAPINDVLNAINVLTWDARVCMPAGAAASRAEQIATLTAVAQERLLDSSLLDAVAAARIELASADAPSDVATVRSIEAVEEAIAFHQRVPAELTRRLSVAKGRAQHAWLAARADDEFGAFAPHLCDMLVIKREMAASIDAERPAYDALMHEYEPGMTTTVLRALLARLRAELTPLATAIAAAPSPSGDVVRASFDVGRQRAFALSIAERFGYDVSRGRDDVAPHPFEISFGSSDVRITTRYDEHYLPQSMFALWHEAGHGVYEQNADPGLARGALTSDLIGLYAVAGTSYGTHESQSRLWENLVGRSRVFWETHYGALVDTFPERLRGVPLDDFYRAINRVTPSPIRVEADEVTYDLHIMVRVELELALLDGALEIADLPAAWNEAMESTVGVRPRDDRQGVLQDIHWSVGLVGAFPTYTLGNVMASQFFEAARRDDPSIDVEAAKGRYGSLLGWLREHVYRHARTYRADELLQRSTGSGLDPEPYLTYLREKYTSLYGL